MTPEALWAWIADCAAPPLVMGVLNVTPDSFSDGGAFLDAAAAVARGMEMLSEGADLVDIGGESTRPGSKPVDAAEQIRRTQSVIAALVRATGCAVSIDTTLAEVAEAALAAGACVVNDISAGRADAGLLKLVARRRAGLCLMHMQGTPATMQQQPTYVDVVAEVGQFLSERRAAALAAGVDPARILLDPGIGFGKTLEHNLSLLHSLRDLTGLGSPLMVGASRKSFIGRILDQPDPGQRVHGSVAAALWSVTNGARVLRVHDVRATVEALRVWRALGGEPAMA